MGERGGARKANSVIETTLYFSLLKGRSCGGEKYRGEEGGVSRNFRRGGNQERGNERQLILESSGREKKKPRGD